jgi:hypothetical protein
MSLPRMELFLVGADFFAGFVAFAAVVDVAFDGGFPFFVGRITRRCESGFARIAATTSCRRFACSGVTSTETTVSPWRGGAGRGGDGAKRSYTETYDGEGPVTAAAAGCEVRRRGDGRASRDFLGGDAVPSLPRSREKRRWGDAATDGEGGALSSAAMSAKVTPLGRGVGGSGVGSIALQ